MKIKEFLKSNFEYTGLEITIIVGAMVAAGIMSELTSSKYKKVLKENKKLRKELEKNIFVDACMDTEYKKLKAIADAQRSELIDLKLRNAILEDNLDK